MAGAAGRPRGALRPGADAHRLLSHPQVLANGTVVEADHPAAGRLRQARPAARFSETPAEPGRPAPALGADTREVLAEAGLSEAAIEALAPGRGAG
jgi:crotonobetainyl-CoA:carnitine CoA-transferase CaiB-like acyl-CoA transferase